jgi:hypothetical protein
VVTLPELGRVFSDVGEFSDARTPITPVSLSVRGERCATVAHVQNEEERVARGSKPGKRTVSVCGCPRASTASGAADVNSDANALGGPSLRIRMDRSERDRLNNVSRLRQGVVRCDEHQ